MTPVRTDDDGTYVDVDSFADEAPMASDPPDPAASDETAAPAPTASTSRKRPPRALLLAIGGLVGLGVVWGVWSLGEPANQLPAGHPSVSAAPVASGAPAASASARPLDEAKIAEWTTKVTADPSDVATLRSLAAEYFRVGKYAESATWQAKIVELRPADVDNRLILGVAYYSDGRYDQAEAQWLKAAELAPTSADPWYNLGFLYLSLEVPDDKRAEAAWQKVVDMAPGTDLARTAAGHLDRLNTSVSAQTSPAPSAPSPVPSPTPTK